MEFTGRGWSAKDILHMKRCLNLAEKGKYQVGDNPMVGSVWVKGDEIISEGFHKKFGADHAEVDAWKKAGQPSTFHEGTIYVSLEPCNHHGKTPPCSDLLIRLRPKRIVIGSTDPDIRVAGKGIKRLSDSGIEVLSGCLDRENRWLNRHYFTQRECHRPFVTLKWAETLEGKVGQSQAKPESRLIISGQPALVYGHRLRAEHQAILVGGGTILADNPKLNLRNFTGNSPKVLVWWNRSAPDQPFLFQSNSNFKEIVQASLKDAWPEIIEYAGNSVLVEGGPKIQTQFIEMGLWDEIHRIVSQNPQHPGDIAAPTLPDNAQLVDSIPIGSDIVYIYHPKK